VRIGNAAAEGAARLFKMLLIPREDPLKHVDIVSSAARRMASEGIVLEIVAAFGRSTRPMMRAAVPPAWLQAARDYTQESNLAPLSMRQVAHAAGRHEIHVAREFRRFFGISPGGYARRLRAERVAQLLLRPYVSIGEIASDCGFSSHSHLCRDFKAQFGLTPSEYRRGLGER